MSKVFSIVRTVAPDADCSYRRGRTEVDFRCKRIGLSHEEAGIAARQSVEACNEHCHCPGVAYTVEEVGEQAADRAPNEYVQSILDACSTELAMNFDVPAERILGIYGSKLGITSDAVKQLLCDRIAD